MVENQNTGKVSVLLINYNYAHYLPEALDSIFFQTYKNWELIAADDGSKDDSLAVLQLYQQKWGGRMKIVRHPGGVNRGIAATYQLALSHANGEYVAFLEADDVWHPENLEKKMNAWTDCPQAVVVFSSYEVMGRGRAAFYWKLYAWMLRRQLPCGRCFDAFPHFLKRNPAASFSHFAVRRSFFEQIPKAPSRLKNYDWWVLAHASAQAPFCFLPERHTYWRIHPASAAYGRSGKILLGRLWKFLEVLYASLAPSVQGRSHEARLHRARAFLVRLRSERMRAVLETSIMRPLQALRFTAFLFLRRICFSSGKEPAA